MVNDKVNDMFEQQQNTGKLEERNKALDKRERVVFSKEERETIYDKVLASVEFTDKGEATWGRGEGTVQEGQCRAAMGGLQTMGRKCHLRCAKR